MRKINARNHLVTAHLPSSFAKEHAVHREHSLCANCGGTICCRRGSSLLCLDARAKNNASELAIPPGPPKSAAIYDGSFEGLLNVIFDAYTEKRFFDLVLPPGEMPPLTVSETRLVITNRARADRVFAGLVRRLSRTGKNTLLLAFLSEKPGSSTHLFQYMRAVFDDAVSPEHDYARAAILAVDRLAKAVYEESILLRGFTRFQKTADGIYCGIIGPKYNVLTLLLAHFTARFATHPWMLYDAVRGYGFYHDTKNLTEVILDPDLVREGMLEDNFLDRDEKVFQVLWQTYFSAATVRERLNPALQARCLPRRFWRYMTEMRR